MRLLGGRLMINLMLIGRMSGRVSSDRSCVKSCGEHTDVFSVDTKHLKYYFILIFLF